MQILTIWFISALIILVLAYVLPGITVADMFTAPGLVTALAVALVLGLVNAIIRPILLILTLPVNILTLGLFTFVINGLMVLLVAKIVPGFEVSGFWWAVPFSIILSLTVGLMKKGKL